VDQRQGQCCVRYDLGGEAWLALAREHFRWLGPRAGSAPAMKVPPSPAAARESPQ
jgi:hypothetical protein